MCAASMNINVCTSMIRGQTLEEGRCPLIVRDQLPTPSVQPRRAENRPPEFIGVNREGLVPLPG